MRTTRTAGRTTARILPLCLAAALVPAALAGAAHADPAGPDGAGISLSPSEARPGATVEIRVDCSARPGGRPSGVSSPGFEQGTVALRAADGSGRYRAEATAVDRAGVYGVDGDCLGDQGTDGTSQFVAELTIAGDPVPTPTENGTGDTDTDGAAAEPESAEEPPRPSGRVDAGHGPDRTPGAGTLAGIAAALAGVGGGAWLLRRRHPAGGG